MLSYLCVEGWIYLMIKDWSPKWNIHHRFRGTSINSFQIYQVNYQIARGRLFLLFTHLTNCTVALVSTWLTAHMQSRNSQLNSRLDSTPAIIELNVPRATWRGPQVWIHNLRWLFLKVAVAEAVTWPLLATMVAVWAPSVHAGVHALRCLGGAATCGSDASRPVDSESWQSCLEVGPAESSAYTGRKRARERAREHSDQSE